MLFFIYQSYSIMPPFLPENSLREQTGDPT
jgi:hypothetical protein